VDGKASVSALSNGEKWAVPPPPRHPRPLPRASRLGRIAPKSPVCAVENMGRRGAKGAILSRFLQATWHPKTEPLYVQICTCCPCGGGPNALTTPCPANGVSPLPLPKSVGLTRKQARSARSGHCPRLLGCRPSARLRFIPSGETIKPVELPQVSMSAKHI